MMTDCSSPPPAASSWAGSTCPDRIAAKRDGLVPDEPFVYRKVTGAEYLGFVGELYGVPMADRKKRVTELMEMFELATWGGELLESYSDGMREKLVIAGILLHDPKVLVLDEPMVGLDPKSGRLVKDIFTRLAARGTAIFMCTHVLEIAEKLCHRIAVMSGGKMIACGNLEELRAASSSSARDEKDLESIFLSLTGGAEYATLLKYQVTMLLRRRRQTFQPSDTGRPTNGRATRRVRLGRLRAFVRPALRLSPAQVPRHRGADRPPSDMEARR